MSPDLFQSLLYTFEEVYNLFFFNMTSGWTMKLKEQPYRVTVHDRFYTFPWSAGRPVKNWGAFVETLSNRLRIHSTCLVTDCNRITAIMISLFFILHIKSVLGGWWKRSERYKESLSFLEFKKTNVIFLSWCCTLCSEPFLFCTVHAGDVQCFLLEKQKGGIRGSGLVQIFGETTFPKEDQVAAKQQASWLLRAIITWNWFEIILLDINICQKNKYWGISIDN